ncbi:MAG: SIS domain-containing protein [bacterium]|nr:SIS domain-containing protein [bacterium]
MSVNILDSFTELRKLDSKNMLGSLQSLSKQMAQIKEQTAKLKLKPLKGIKNIVVAGTGGSALGAHIIKSVFYNELAVPLEIVNNYHLPHYVNKNSLVIVSSYSGGTEEAVSALEEALWKRARVAVVASGGALADYVVENKLSAIIFTTANNPCGSPRMGLGYSIFGQIILLSKFGLLDLSFADLADMIKAVDKFDFEFGAGKLAKDNLAKQLAKKIGESSVWLVGAEHLAGNAHVAANQMNENSKRFAGYFLIPELNHHLMEGMMNPKSNSKNLLFIFIESPHYDQRVGARFGITKQVLEKNNIHHLVFQTTAKDKPAEMCEALVFFAYVSYYNAILNGIDPVAIPFVDFFKEQLKK